MRRLRAEIEAYDKFAGDRDIVDLRWRKRPISSRRQCGVATSRTQRIIPVIDYFSVINYPGFIDMDLHTYGNRCNKLLIAGHPDNRARPIDGNRVQRLRLFSQAPYQRYFSE